MVTATHSEFRPAPTALTTSLIEELAPTRLLQTPPDPLAAASSQGPSDYDLNPGHEADFAGFEPYRSAAVLVPIVTRQTPYVLLTLRTSTLALDGSVRPELPARLAKERYDAGSAAETAPAFTATARPRLPGPEGP